MADKKIIRIKKEKTNCVSSLTDSLFLQAPLPNGNHCADMKEEPGLNFDAGGSEDNFLGGHLSVGNPCVGMKEEPELNLDAYGFEHNNLEDQSIISESNESIKEDVELNLEAEETESFAHANLQQFEGDQLEDTMRHEKGAGVAILPQRQQQHPLPMALLQHSAARELVVLQHPATPPNSPPASLSPTLPMSAVAMATASALLEDTGLSAAHYLAPEAQDTQSIRTANGMTEPVGAPLLAAAVGTVEAVSSTAGNLSVDGASHHNFLHQYCGEQMSAQPPDARSISRTSQQYCQQNHYSGPTPPQNSTSTASSGKDIINDDALVSLPVSELKVKLGAFPKEEVERLKHKRRALKNRSYAQNRRNKWLQQRRELEITNRTLVAELKHIKTELVRVSRQRDLYKRYLEEELCDGTPTPHNYTALTSTMKSPPDVS